MLSRTCARLTIAALGLSGCTGPTDTEIGPAQYWFACEQGRSNGCETLKIEGYELSGTGAVYHVSETTREVLVECGLGACFLANDIRIDVEREAVGTFDLNAGSLTVSIAGCTETVPWAPTPGDPLEYSGTCLVYLANAPDDLVWEYEGFVCWPDPEIPGATPCRTPTGGPPPPP